MLRIGPRVRDRPSATATLRRRSEVTGKRLFDNEWIYKATMHPTRVVRPVVEVLVVAKTSLCRSEAHLAISMRRAPTFRDIE